MALAFGLAGRGLVDHLFALFDRFYPRRLFRRLALRFAGVGLRRFNVADTGGHLGSVSRGNLG